MDWRLPPATCCCSPTRPGWSRDTRSLSTFRILVQSGASLTWFVEQHERAMQLIVVRRDLVGFQLLRAAMRADGIWTIKITLATAGAWRAFADHATDCWAATYFAVGQFSLIDLPAPDSTAGTEVRGVHPANRVGSWSPSELAFPVACDRQPVNDLDPYLGARGRLVALRERESRGAARAPRRHPDPGASISLSAALPSAGHCRLFLQFQDRGVVQTVAFTERYR